MTKHIFVNIILFFLFSVQNTFGQIGWFEQVSGTNAGFRGMDVVDTNRVWIVGGTGDPNSGKILYTTNGGTNWVTKLSGIVEYFMDIYAIDTSTVLATGTNGTILKTTNAGINWIAKVTNTTNRFWGITFINNTIGWAVGETGTIRKTTDGGENWIAQVSNTNESLRKVDFFNANTGVITGTGVLLRTTNGGNNWVNVFNGMFGMGMSLMRSGIGIGFIGAYNTNVPQPIYKTTNYGLNWVLQNSGLLTSDIILDTYFLNSDTGYMCGKMGIILYTSNGGSNWILRNRNPIDFPWFWEIQFANNNIGWIAGDAGKIYKTTTGGITIIKQISNNVPNQFQLYQNYPNPFNPETNIKFSIPISTKVRLILYDLKGETIEFLVSEQVNAGIYSFNFRNDNLSSGVYFYRIEADNFVQSRKMILIK